MGVYSKEDIIRIVREEEIEFVRLQFTDIFGMLKNVAITASQIEKAVSNQCMFDGSSIEGFVRIDESDQYLYPDLKSFRIFPWRPSHGKVARLICDVYNTDGTPFVGDPRYVLKRVIQKANDMGYDRFNVGPEAEFFLFKTDEEGKPTTQTNDEAGYFDLGPLDHGESTRREICMALEQMDFEIEASHHECAQGQHEMSLFRNGKNAFYDPDDPRGLSKEAYSFIAGLLHHVRGMAAVTNPLVNSYKRLVPGYEAPCYLAWSASNRSALIRIPASRGQGTRVELRSPDPSCNPYLAFAVCLAAGLDGMEKGMTPPAEITENIYAMDAAARKAHGIESLPGSLEEAHRALEADQLILDTLGEHVAANYLTGKWREWDEYRTRVSSWEREKYIINY